MIKTQLRKIYLGKRSSLSQADVSALSGRIAGHFFAAFDLSNVSSVHCFLSIPSFHEVDTALIYERLWREYPGILTVTSRTGSTKDELEHAKFAADTSFSEGKWGIREPLGEALVDPQSIDIVLVPLLCFDKRGNRAGYGKGFYDRFLAKCRPDCLKIGLSFFPPVDSIDDVHDHDVALDRCITPERVMTFG